MNKKRVVVICPGRGSYTKDNLGYLTNQKSIQLDLDFIDPKRKELGFPTISELDGADQFKTAVHTKGEHASPLIYLAAKSDFLKINREKYEIVAIAGNSMGWYLSLAFGGALNPQDSFHLIQTMGAMMKDGLVGGQIIYPIIDDSWKIDHEQVELVNSCLKKVNSIDDCQVFTSIHLGGYKVLAGNKKGLTELIAMLPKKEHYPFQLVNHGAFHTPLLKDVSEKAEHSLYQLQFKAPQVPLIDGTGRIWQPYSTDKKDIYDYTIGHQVVEPYDFSTSVKVALKEFNPDHLILLGPGNSLGGALGQVLIENRWLGLSNKTEFIERQKQDPFIISMGLDGQRTLVTH